MTQSHFPLKLKPAQSSPTWIADYLVTTTLPTSQTLFGTSYDFLFHRRAATTLVSWKFKECMGQSLSSLLRIAPTNADGQPSPQRSFGLGLSQRRPGVMELKLVICFDNRYHFGGSTDLQNVYSFGKFLSCASICLLMRFDIEICETRAK